MFQAITPAYSSSRRIFQGQLFLDSVWGAVKPSFREVIGKVPELPRKRRVLQPPRIYRKAGIGGQSLWVDSIRVNVHGIIPARWLTLGMLLLNLLVWLDAAAQLPG
jgi:hypothetical protein